MSDSKISERAAQAQTRMAHLQQRGLLPDALEELHASIEELRVAEEEMRVQNEELSASRLRVEAERHRYQDLFEFAPDGYLVTSAEGVILEANRAASRLLNIAPRFLRNRPLAVLVSPEDLREFRARLAALPLESSFDSPQEWTMRLRRRAAAPFHAALTVAPARLYPQEAVTLRWIMRDISDRIQAEEAGRRQIASILETITDAFITLDPLWRFTYLNASAANLCRAAGKDPEKLLGQILWDEFPTALGTAFQTEALRAVETGRLAEFEEYSRGLGRWLQVRVFPSPAGVVAYAQDVTDRKAAEAALQTAYEKERRISGILQNLLLRTVPPNAFPHLTLETFYEAASSEAQIGGDFFDVFTLGAGRVALVIGDVSGKGLGAAELTAEVKYALRAILREVEEPGQALARLNDFVCEAQRQGDLGSNHLVALSLVTIDPETGDAACLSAGGEPPLLLRADGTAEAADTSGLLLGVQPGVIYAKSRFRLQSGDTLALLTDGLTEARQQETGTLLGDEGLQQLARQGRTQKTLHGLGRTLMDGAHAWAGGALQDDACLLLARWK